jgi:predicted DsbA family dithiol-disulfide isomerase
MPPHLLAKAAARLGPGAFADLHWLLLEAYFFENRDITAAAVQEELWQRAGLPAADLRRREDPSLRQQVLDEHREALEHGAGGVPAVRLESGFGVVMGAQPAAVYRRWVERAAAPFSARAD